MQTKNWTNNQAHTIRETQLGKHTLSHTIRKKKIIHTQLEKLNYTHIIRPKHLEKHNMAHTHTHTQRHTKMHTYLDNIIHKNKHTFTQIVTYNYKHKFRHTHTHTHLDTHNQTHTNGRTPMKERSVRYTSFSKGNVKTNFMDIRSVGAKLLRKSEGRTEKHGKFKCRLSQFCERSYDKRLSMLSGCWSLLSLHCQHNL